MNRETIFRAKTLIKREEVILYDDFVPGRHYHFGVKQRSGRWVDVWCDINRAGFMEWSCNAVDEKWGCVMHTGDKKKPFCSHTLAAKMLMDQLKYLEVGE